MYQNRWGLWQFEIPSDGEFTIRMTITGKDQGTAGYLGIDCVEII
ncbi:hypothetical protein [Clostridium celatum]|uniref:Uncharacterized protein n=1 Tax=Clostridium celatum DSM 1785 TaxID=545697 RepID=L1QKT0_9CLOT|nr:hypothetical protein [Clostridium celatum]EKY28583.1 hypothetical protein HMPREF0216_00636 [Clostridium celatum DSM 1785]